MPDKKSDYLAAISTAASNNRRSLADRDKVILEAYRDPEGPGPTEIGRAAGITKGRVLQIVGPKK